MFFPKAKEQHFAKRGNHSSWEPALRFTRFYEGFSKEKKMKKIGKKVSEVLDFKEMRGGCEMN